MTEPIDYRMPHPPEVSQRPVFIARAYLMFARLLSYLQSLALLILRLAWGYELAQSGWGHLTHLANTTDFFQRLNIPLPHVSAITAGSTELVGGILIMAGLATRLIALPVLFNFCIAYATDGLDTIKALTTDPTKFIDYTAFPFLMLSLIMIAFGPGKISFDFLIKYLTVPRPPPQPPPWQPPALPQRPGP